MAHRTNAANARGEAGHFGIGPAFTEFFEPAEFNHMKLGVGDLPGVIQKDADFGVAFDAGDGVDDNTF